MRNAKHRLAGVNEGATAGAPDAPSGQGFSAEGLPAVFELLARLARAVTATVGPDAEVVVHDLRTPEHSVIAISGHLTGREVGAPVPDSQLLPGEVDKFTEDDLRRRATTDAGRELLASTVWVRDAVGHIVGALCVNLDLSGLQRARELLDRHLGPTEAGERPLPTFATDVSHFVRLAIAQVRGPAPRRRLRPAERQELVRRLEAEGVFALRHAPEAVAEALAVSRASVYADLRVVRQGVDRAFGPVVAKGRQLPMPLSQTRRVRVAADEHKTAGVRGSRRRAGQPGAA